MKLPEAIQEKIRVGDSDGVAGDGSEGWCQAVFEFATRVGQELSAMQNALEDWKKELDAREKALGEQLEKLTLDSDHTPFIALRQSIVGERGYLAMLETAWGHRARKVQRIKFDYRNKVSAFNRERVKAAREQERQEEAAAAKQEEYEKLRQRRALQGETGLPETVEEYEVMQADQKQAERAAREKEVGQKQFLREKGEKVRKRKATAWLQKALGGKS